MVGARIGGVDPPRGKARPLAGLFALIAVLALLVLLADLLIGPPTAAGAARSAERIDVSSGGVPVEAAGGFSGAPGAVDPLRNSADGDRVVGALLADLEEFWSTVSGLPPEAVRPAGGIHSMDGSMVGSAAGPDRALCITDPGQIAGNAFYCPAQDGIVFDAAALVPVLLGSYGTAGLAAAFAHEFGHAMQARQGPTQADRQADPDRYPAILIEAQADCAAGAFLAHAASASGASGPPEGGATRVHLPPASLGRAVAPLLDFRDAPTVSPADATAHGLSLDRLGFVLRGFRGGGPACWSMTTADLTGGDTALTLGRPGTVAPGDPRFASTADAVAAASESVAAFAGGPAAAPDPADLRRAGSIGQFAAGTAVALETGRTRYDTPAGAACFAGAWTASRFGSAGAGELGSWATDADEALDLLRSRPGVGFDELAAFADGFHRGRAAC